MAVFGHSANDNDTAYGTHDRIWWSRFQATSGDGLGIKISVKAGGNVDCKCAIYTDDKAFIMGTGTVTVPLVSAFTDFNFTDPPFISNGLFYLLAIMRPGAANMNLTANTSTNNSFYDIIATDVWPDPLVQDGTVASEILIYCTYTPFQQDMTITGNMTWH